MSVLARPQWFSPPPARLQQAELSPLSEGSPSGGEGDAEGGCAGYGGSLIMVQHECSVDTERAAEAESLDGERLCSVVLDPLPSALLHSLGARGHVRMLRPPAAATSWPPSPTPPPAPQEDQQEDVRGIVQDLVSAVESDASATQCAPQEPLVAPPSPVNEHRHRKKHRKARRESHESEGRRKRRKRSTSSSSGSYCTTPGPGSEVKKIQSTPRVNPIFVWVTQSEESTITKVLCEDYDKRNRIRLTKTPSGWRAIPRTERLAVMQPTVQQHENTRSPSPDPEISLDLSPTRNRTPSSPSNELFTPTLEESEELGEEELVLRFDEEHEEIEMTEDELQADHEPESNEVVVEKPSEEEITNNNSDNVELSETIETKIEEEEEESENKVETEVENECEEVLEAKIDYETHEKDETIESNVTGLEIDAVSDDTSVPDLIHENVLKIEPETLEGEPLKTENKVLDRDEIKTKPEKIHELETEILNLVPKKLDNENGEDIECKKPTVMTEKDLTISSDGEKTPPPAHASSVALKTEGAPEPAADLSSSKRRRRLSGLLPCRSPLRLPPLQARPLPSPVAVNGGDQRTPSPAHRQIPCVPPPKSALCGSLAPTPAHQHERHSPFLETLLTQKPLALETKRPSASFDPPPKRRRSEDITLRTLLGGPGQSATTVEAVAPRSRLLELLTTSPPPRKPATESTKRKQLTPLTIPTPPQPSAPQDALSELRQVLAEVQVPDPLLVPRSRLASLLASPAAEIPRLVRSPPISAPDTLAVSLSRLQALLRRPDSELLAWAAQDWAVDPTLKPSSKPQVIPKVPVTKPKLPTVTKPVQKHSPVTPPITPSSLPWWLPASNKPSSSSVLPPSPDILAAFHAMYGSAMLSPNYFAPSFPHELSVWPGFAEVTKPPNRPPMPELIKSTATPAVSKPRIACKSLLELLATKPQEPGAPVLDLAPPPAPSKHVDKRQQHHHHHHHQQQQQQSRDSRLWHPLFGSQKSDAWNWRPLTVHGD